jgi:transposase-like protein
MSQRQEGIVGKRIRGTEVAVIEKRGKRGEWSEDDKAGIVERVLEGMAEGHTLSETVSVVSAALEEKLTAGVVRRWIVAQEEWFLRYQRTKTMLGQAFAEEAILVARESTSSTTATDRVLIETLKWAAAKANPVEYGEKQTVEHQGAQTLSVKIVEDDAPVRNVMALNAAGRDALVSAVVYAPAMMTLPASSEAGDEE